MTSNLAHLPFDLMRTITDEDTDMLQNLFESIKESVFQNKITASVEWGIPEPTSPRQAILSTFTLKVGSEDLLNYAEAIGFVHKCKEKEAIPLLRVLADKGHRDSQTLLIQILQKINNDLWQTLAKNYNSNVSRIINVSPASISVIEDSAVIRVHPTLLGQRNARAPRYVMKYVIQHECLHRYLSTTRKDPHPEHFLMHENIIPKRADAIKWLKANNFATIDDEL
ncbi:MAG: hypothetical protein V3T17_09835 [Pseudomonadales bacterium]